MDLWVTLQLDTSYEKWEAEYATAGVVLEAAQEVVGRPKVNLDYDSDGYPLLFFHYPNLCEEHVYRVLRRATEKAKEQEVEIVPDVVALELLGGEDEGRVLEELERLCWKGVCVY